MDDDQVLLIDVPEEEGEEGWTRMEGPASSVLASSALLLVPSSEDEAGGGDGEEPPTQPGGVETDPEPGDWSDPTTLAM